MSGKAQSNGRGKLTAQFVRYADVPGRYHDGAGMGLMLRIMPSGSRQWVQRMMCDNKRIEIGLGSPPVVSLSEARDKAIDNKRLVYRGENPLTLRAAAAAIPTFDEAAEEAIAVLSVGKAAKYEVRFKGALRLHVSPHIGGKKVTAITPRDLNEFLKDLIIHKPSVAKKVKEYIVGVFKWSIGQGFLTSNPMDIAQASLPKIVESGNHRISLSYSEVNAFIDDLRKCNAGPSTRLGLEFLIHTANRSSETRGAVWGEFNFETRLWTIPKERMKGRRAEHIIPLSDQVISILEKIGIRDGKKYASQLVFPASAGQELADARFSRLVKETLGYPVDVHGFRTSFRTWTQEKTDFSEEACELALAHRKGNSVRKAYARSELLEERRPMMQAWSNYLEVPSEGHINEN